MGTFRTTIIDFETTGLSPRNGDRIIEVGAVAVENARIVARFQSLMNPGLRVSAFIENYTGISNRMLAQAPTIAEVMPQLLAFLGEYPLVAHNAAFDQRFLDAECARLGHPRGQPMACSLLLARRVYPEAPGHSLEALVRYKRLTTSGVHHRALADAEMTAHLWLALLHDLKREHALRQLPFELLLQLITLPRKNVPAFLARVAAAQGSAVPELEPM